MRVATDVADPEQCEVAADEVERGFRAIDHDGGTAANEATKCWRGGAEGLGAGLPGYSAAMAPVTIERRCPVLSRCAAVGSGLVWGGEQASASAHKRTPFDPNDSV
jgi:hypothetical protein